MPIVAIFTAWSEKSQYSRMFILDIGFTKCVNPTLIGQVAGKQAWARLSFSFLLRSGWPLPGIILKFIYFFIFYVWSLILDFAVFGQFTIILIPMI